MKKPSSIRLHIKYLRFRADALYHSPLSIPPRPPPLQNHISRRSFPLFHSFHHHRPPSITSRATILLGKRRMCQRGGVTPEGKKERKKTRQNLEGNSTNTMQTQFQTRFNYETCFCCDGDGRTKTFQKFRGQDYQRPIFDGVFCSPRPCLPTIVQLYRNALRIA